MKKRNLKQKNMVYDIKKYDNEPSHFDAIYTEMKDIENTVIELLRNNNIFKIKGILSSFKKWNHRYYFYHYLFQYCSDNKQAQYISSFFENNPPDCGKVFLNDLKHLEKDMYNRITEANCLE